MIPATLWIVFSTGWLDIKKAPADAPDWLAQGYLYHHAQGKLVGYVIAPAGYCWVVANGHID